MSRRHPRRYQLADADPRGAALKGACVRKKVVIKRKDGSTTEFMGRQGKDCPPAVPTAKQVAWRAAFGALAGGVAKKCAEAPTGPVRGACLRSGFAARIETICARKPAAADSAQTTIITPQGREVARYAVVSARALITSHDPRSFRPDPRYPAGTQERTYHTDQNEQAKVVNGAGHLEPAILLATTPTATDGPPIVTRDGIVLGGNGRSMMLRRAYGDGGAEGYRAALAASGGTFGLSRDEVFAVLDPVLVRIVEGLTATSSRAELAKASSRYNEGLTAAMDERAKAISVSRRLSPQTIEQIGGALVEDTTLREAMRADPRRFIRALEADGLITAQNRASLATANGDLTEAGRMLVEGAFLGLVVQTPERFNATAPAILAKLERAIPALVRISVRGNGHDLIPTVQAAVDLLNHARVAGLTADEYSRQGSLTEAAPTEKVRRLAVLLEQRGPRQITTAFRGWAAAADFDPNQKMMFGAHPTPAATFERLFDGIKSPVDGLANLLGAEILDGAATEETADAVERLVGLRREDLVDTRIAFAVKRSKTTLPDRDIDPEIRSRMIRFNETTPPTFTRFPVGTFAADVDGAIYELRRLDIRDPRLVLGEGEKRNPTVEKYEEWIRAGATPPPCRVIEHEHGGLKVADGHHRISALRHEGKPDFLAWVEMTWNVPRPGGRTYPEGVTLALAQQLREHGGHLPPLAAVQEELFQDARRPSFGAWLTREWGPMRATTARVVIEASRLAGVVPLTGASATRLVREWLKDGIGFTQRGEMDSPGRPLYGYAGRAAAPGWEREVRVDFAGYVHGSGASEIRFARLSAHGSKWETVRSDQPTELADALIRLAIAERGGAEEVDWRPSVAIPEDYYAGLGAAPKGTPTDLNIYVLREVFGGQLEVSNQLKPTNVPHMRRCLEAGLVEVDGKKLLLTAAGQAVLRGETPELVLPTDPGDAAPKGASRDLFVLQELFKDREQIPNSFDKRTAPYVRRALQARLVQLAGKKKLLELTEAGRVDWRPPHAIPEDYAGLDAASRPKAQVEDYEEGGRMLHKALDLARAGKAAEAKAQRKAAWRFLNAHGWTRARLDEAQPDDSIDVLSLDSRIDMSGPVQGTLLGSMKFDAGGEVQRVLDAYMAKAVAELRFKWFFLYPAASKALAAARERGGSLQFLYLSPRPLAPHEVDSLHHSAASADIGQQALVETDDALPRDVIERLNLVPMTSETLGAYLHDAIPGDLELSNTPTVTPQSRVELVHRGLSGGQLMWRVTHFEAGGPVGHFEIRTGGRIGGATDDPDELRMEIGRLVGSGQRFLAPGGVSALLRMPYAEGMDPGERGHVNQLSATDDHGEWREVPLFAREAIREEIWAMYASSYATIGMSVKTPAGLSEYDVWNVYTDGATARAFRLEKTTAWGRKAGLAGTDGSPTGKAALRSRMATWFHVEGNYGEVSHAVEHMAQKANAPVVCASDVTRVLNGKTIRIEADGLHYTRLLADVGPITKIMVGRPRSTPTTTWTDHGCAQPLDGIGLRGLTVDSDRLAAAEHLASLLDLDT